MGEVGDQTGVPADDEQRIEASFVPPEAHKLIEAGEISRYQPTKQGDMW